MDQRNGGYGAALRAARAPKRAILTRRGDIGALLTQPARKSGADSGQTR